MDQEKMAWAVVVKHGWANVKLSYYGGWETHDGSYVRVEELSKMRDDALAKVKRVGVDWDKTRWVDDDRISCFNGTFADSTYTKVFYGDLVLKNGDVIEFIMEAGDILDNVFAMMAKAHEYVAFSEEYLK